MSKTYYTEFFPTDTSPGERGSAAFSNNTFVDSSGNIQGVSSGSGTSIANNQDSIIRAPGGGVLISSSSSVTGRLKIRLPQFFTNTMMKFTVDIFEYEAGYSCTMEIAGYNWSFDNSWYNVTARVVGDSNVEYPVFFGHDGSKACVWIGDASTTWSYPQVRLKEFFAGYTNFSKAQWESGWELSFTPVSLVSGNGANQYSNSVLDTLPGADWQKVSGTGKPEDNATVGAVIGTNLTGTFTETEFNNRFTTGIIGGTYIKNASIDTAQIKDLAVAAAKIGELAVTNAKIGNLEVGTIKIANNAVTEGYLAVGNVDYNFASGTKTQMLELTVTKASADSLLEVEAQVEMFGTDAVDIYVYLELYQGGSLYATKRFTLKVDANGSTYLPFVYAYFFGAAAGTYQVRLYGQRFSSNTCSTFAGGYFMRAREFKK